MNVNTYNRLSHNHPISLGIAYPDQAASHEEEADDVDDGADDKAEDVEMEHRAHQRDHIEEEDGSEYSAHADAASPVLA